MPNPVNLFTDILNKIPTTPEAVAAHTAKMDEVIEGSMKDITAAVDEVKALEEKYPEAVTYLLCRAEILLSLLTFDLLHLARETCGVQMHEYTITPNELLNALAF